MPPMNLLIKPASSKCNMQCKYCFYDDVSSLRDIKSYGFMSGETLEVIVRKSLEEATDFVTFAFQGGEPTLCGLEFYKKLIGYVNKYNPKKLNILYVIQTNGMLIDEEWAKFFHDNNFLVGISLDGYKKTHDKYRRNYASIGTFDIVMRAIGILNHYQVDYNILSVVTAYMADHTEKVYQFFKKNNFGYLQFIPCIDDFDAMEEEFSLTAEQYERFLKELFDLWYEDCMNGRGISIRYFDNWYLMMAGEPPESCSMRGICSCQFVIEADGSVYPCDFYVLDRLKLGNVRENGFEELRNSAAAREFIQASLQIDSKCEACKYVTLCRGGCRRDRENTGGQLGSNRFCESYYNFFEYSIERFQKLLSLGYE